MLSCPACQGFVPDSQSVCPHCDTSVEAPRGRGPRLRDMIALGVMAGSTSVTMMACYGAPCGPGECGFDGTGGYGEPVCNPSTMSEDLGDAALPIMIEGSLEASGTNEGSCGGNGGERVYTWTPPAAGTYRIRTTTDFDTVLYVRDASGGVCGDELACNDEAPDNSTTGPSQVEVTLGTEPVAIVVDGFLGDTAGDFSLVIEAVE